MEALAALGVAANICQFLEYGLELICKAKDLRELGAVNPSLQTDAERLRDLSSALDPQRIPPHAGDISQLARECARVSEALISELSKLKPSDPTSKRQRLKSLVKSELKKPRLQELESRLQTCRSQLSLHLTLISRDEANQKLDKITHSGPLVQNQLAALNSVAKDLIDSKHLTQDILTEFQTLAKNYNESLIQSRQMAILDMLRFPNMHERMDSVADAYEETFRWLMPDETANRSERFTWPEQERLTYYFSHDLEEADKSERSNDSDERDNSEEGHDGEESGSAERPEYVEETKQRARQVFITWLRTGNEFFHISGKPGAGKSTLMKYITQHPKLREHLEHWCQNSRLSIGQFFFWKPGNAEQKSLKGLVRGILYSILNEDQDLIPIAFPELWDLLLTRSRLASGLEYRDFRQGLENLLLHAAHTSSVRFALFIDGLDEFDGRHLDLIQTMKQWTTRFPTSLKICVSSREYSIFQESFRSYPKLRLHELTRGDMVRMISGRLQSNNFFRELLPSESQEIAFYHFIAMIESIVDKAEGVFLWVSLVLSAIEDGLISGDNFEDLSSKIDSYPTELEPLYRRLVQEIHVSDRQWAFRTLKLVHFLQSKVKEAHDSLFARLFDSDFLFTCSFESDLKLPFTMNLLQLSFLDDLKWEYKVFQDIPTEEQNSTAVQKRIVNTQRKVYGRCKGFLTVQRDGPESWSFGNPLELSGLVVFTHRSLIEFLETPEMTEMMSSYTSSFNCFESACHTLLSCVKLLHPSTGVFSNHIFTKKTGPYTLIGIFCPSLLMKIQGYITMAMRLHCSDSENFILFLNFMGQILDTLLPMTGLDSSRMLKPSDWLTLKSLCWGAFEYQGWRNRQPSTPSIPKLSQDYLASLFHECYREGTVDDWSSYWTQDRFMNIMNGFVTLGLELNLRTDSGILCMNRYHIGFTIWQQVLWDLLDDKFPRSWSPGALIDWFLRHGADPALTMGRLAPGGPYQLPWEPHNGGLEVFRPFSPDSFSFASLLYGRELRRPDVIVLIKETSLLCKITKEKRGPVKLLDVLTLWFPEHAAYFAELIQHLQSATRIENSGLEGISAPQNFKHSQCTWIEWDRIICDETDIKWGLQRTKTTARELDEQALKTQGEEGTTNATLNRDDQDLLAFQDLDLSSS
ncbi:hypothetical protein F5Y16DRAFT_372069 [Xylariaceae sp. FL0255]|nr:hypothetical protein F5Y16DRAFT_372069 [Xylariaceae sp. FL0255]